MHLGCNNHNAAYKLKRNKGGNDLGICQAAVTKANSNSGCIKFNRLKTYDLSVCIIQYKSLKT